MKRGLEDCGEAHEAERRESLRSILRRLGEAADNGQQDIRRSTPFDRPLGAGDQSIGSNTRTLCAMHLLTMYLSLAGMSLHPLSQQGASLSDLSLQAVFRIFSILQQSCDDNFEAHDIVPQTEHLRIF